MRIEAVVFGEALWDIFPDAERLGGAPLNFAVRLAELGHRTALVTRIGTDPRGDAILDMLRSTRVDLSLIQRDPGRPTGTVPVTLDDAGHPSYVITPDVAYDRIEAGPAAIHAVAGARCLYYGTLAQRAPKSQAALHLLLENKTKDLDAFCDVNLRSGCYSAATVMQSVKRATVLKLNEDEIGPVADILEARSQPAEFAADILDKFWAREVVMTLGDRGAIVFSRQGAVYSPGRRTEVADLVGAGDAFAAAYVHGLLRGWPTARRLAYANAVGAMVAGQPGATVPLDLDRLSTSSDLKDDAVVDDRFAGFWTRQG